MSTSAPEQPRAIGVDFVGDDLVVTLADGRSVHVPLAWFPRLEAANREELDDWRLVGKGVGIHWPRLDEDLSVSGLLAPLGHGAALERLIGVGRPSPRPSPGTGEGVRKKRE